jgi:RHS repeat-associated protein
MQFNQPDSLIPDPYNPLDWNRDLPTTYQYTDQRNKSAIGLYDYGARFYDPALGRFVQADTVVPGVGIPMAWDRYAYVKNNPINLSDPSGNKACQTMEMASIVVQMIIGAQMNWQKSSV